MDFKRINRGYLKKYFDVIRTVKNMLFDVKENEKYYLFNNFLPERTGRNVPPEITLYQTIKEPREVEI